MSTNIDEIVKSYDESITLRDEQKQVFQYLLQNKGDLIVSLPVGFGKSILFHLLPQILKGNNVSPICITISPLNIIQKDQIKSLKDHQISACRLDIKSRVGESTDDECEAQCDSDLARVKKGDFSVVLCHPEALFNTQVGRELLSDEEFVSRVVAVVVDECHVIEKWGEEFRSAFKKLSGLKAFFPSVPVVGLSGTLTLEQKENIPKLLGLGRFHIIQHTPDRPNIFLQKLKKEPATDVIMEYEQIVHKICDELFEKKRNFPVTLLFLPIFYMSEAMVYLQSLFGSQSIEESLFSAICSGQDEYVINRTIVELKKDDPNIRLVLTTSIAGMGFDPKNVTRVIHACPPRNTSQYLQEIGRAGRSGQPSSATLYYHNRDIGKNLPGIKDDIISYCKNDSSCLRNELLSVFGFEKDSNIIACQCCSYCADNCTCESCVSRVNIQSMQNMHM